MLSQFVFGLVGQWAEVSLRCLIYNFRDYLQ